MGSLFICRIFLHSMDATRASSRVARFLSHLLPVANAHSTNLTPIPTNGHATTNFTLSSHVLDTNLGVPAKGMPVRLEKQISAQPLQYKLLSRHETNADGRVPMKDFGEFVEAGIYRVTFDTAAYFKVPNTSKANSSSSSLDFCILYYYLALPCFFIMLQ